jgi:hypothetical protein
LEVDYFSRTRGIFDVQFDGAKSPYVACAKDVILKPSEQWEQAEFRVRNARFENSQNGKADFRLIVLASELTVRRVSVSGLKKAEAGRPSPLDALDGIPTRDPQAPPNLIDLSPFYNFALTDDLQDAAQGNDAATLPQGLQPFGGVAFDVRGLVQLAGKKLVKNTGRNCSTSVTNMPLNRKAARLHFLHGTGYTESDGTRIGAYVLNYADGQKHELPILYGQHLRDWWRPEAGDEIETARARVVWTGENAAARKCNKSLRLYLMSEPNPRPGVEIKSISFVSAMTMCAPFLIAITAE